MTGPQGQGAHRTGSVTISEREGRSPAPSTSGHCAGPCASAHPQARPKDPTEPGKAQSGHAPRFAIVNEPITTNRNESDQQ